MSEVLIGGVSPVLPTLLLSSLLVQGLGVLLPVFIMVVYDHVIDGRAPVGYAALLTGMAVALAAEAALRRIRGTLLVRAGIRAETFWINRLVAQLIHLPAALVERASLSSQLNRLKGVEIFRDMAVSPIVLGALDVPFVAVVLLVMFLVAGELVLIPLMLIGAYLTIMLAALPWIKSTLRKQARMSDHQQGLVLEASHNHLALRADGLTDIWMERIASNGAQSMATTSRSTFLQHALEVISLMGSSIAGLLTLSAGVSMVQAGTLSAGGLIASMMLVWRMLAPLSLLCTALPRLVQMFQTSLQLTQFLTTLPLLDPSPMADLWEASPTRAARLLGFYLEDLPGQLSAIQNALTNRNAAEVGNIAHSLKSSSRQMGALKIGEAAFRVEQAARSNPPDPYLPQFVQSLSGLMPATVNAVSQQLKSHAQN